MDTFDINWRFPKIYGKKKKKMIILKLMGVFLEFTEKRKTDIVKINLKFPGVNGKKENTENFEINRFSVIFGKKMDNFKVNGRCARINGKKKYELF